MPTKYGTAEIEFFQEWARTTGCVKVGAPDDKFPYEERVKVWNEEQLDKFSDSMPRDLLPLLQESKTIFLYRQHARDTATKPGGGPGIRKVHKQVANIRLHALRLPRASYPAAFVLAGLCMCLSVDMGQWLCSLLSAGFTTVVSAL